MALTSQDELERMPEEERIRVARELMAKAEALLAWPRVKTTVGVEPEGAMRIVIEPLLWGITDVVEMFRVAHELRSFAMEGLRRRELEAEPEKG